MNKLLSDPSFSVCPDFMAKCCWLNCTSMVSDNVMETQAVETLCTIWVTTNEDLCVEWQVQLAKDK
jgi:hypothetical protein